MRVLLYVEPFPIRNSMIHFKDVARQFGALIDVSVPVDIRLYANEETLDALPRESATQIGASIIRPTEDEQDLFRTSIQDWDEDGMDRWRDIMLGGAAADAHVKVLHSIWRRFPFDVIVHWGENGAVRRFCSESSAIEIAAELGCTRPPFFSSVVLDLFGTNGAGLLPRLTIDDVDQIVKGEGLSAETALLAYSENLDSVGYEKQFSPLHESVSAAISEHGGKVAFLPLQLYDDANMLLFSKYETIQDVVLDVVPKLVENGYLVLIKPHPASKFRGSAIRENTAARASLSTWRRKIVWCDPDKGNFENAPLMSVSDLVVTVNSSVGFEATYYDKIVCVLGDAVYKPAGMFPSLDEICSGRFSAEVYLRKLSFLRRFVLEAYLAPVGVLKDSSLFYARLGSLVAMARLGLSPRQAAEQSFQIFAGFQRQHHMNAMSGGLTRPGVGDFSLGKSTSVTLTAVPGLDPSINQQKILKSLMAATGQATKTGLSKYLRTKWSETESRGALMEAAELFDADHYKAENRDVAESGMMPLRHFILYGEKENRSPHPKINLGEHMRTSAASTDYGLLSILLSLISESNLRDAERGEDEDEDFEEGRVIRDFPLAKGDKALIASAHHELRTQLAERANRIAVVAHLYYRDIVPEILGQLRAIPESFDLIVTLPVWGASRIEQMVREQVPNAVFCPLPNRGRDIGPFIEILPRLVEKNYLAVLKLQTKRGYYVAGKLKPGLGRLWRDIVLDSLLGSSGQVGQIIGAFEALPGLNMVGPAPFLLPLAEYPYHDRGQFASNFTTKISPRSGFFAGTMFWFRPAVLAPLVTGSNRLSIKSFDPENSETDGQLAHLVERLFGHLSGLSRYGIGTVEFSGGQGSVATGVSPADLSIHKYLVRRMESRFATRSALIW